MTADFLNKVTVRSKRGDWMYSVDRGGAWPTMPDYGHMMCRPELFHRDDRKSVFGDRLLEWQLYI